MCLVLASDFILPKDSKALISWTCYYLSLPEQPTVLLLMRRVLSVLIVSIVLMFA